MSEKGGVDLLWLLTNEPGGAREARMWTDDFGTLYEGYVGSILQSLGARLGGQYVRDVHYGVAGDDAGQIDALVRAGTVLAIIEVKASQVRPTLLSHGTVEQVRDDLERKFVGDAGGRKGVSQLEHAIHWLTRQRSKGQRFEGIDLKGIDTIIPVLIAADRHLRYPGLGQWFDYNLQEVLRVVTPRVQPLVICGTEDLENLEHLALRAGPTVMESLIRYARNVRRAAEPLWMHYDSPRGPHPRLDAVFDSWITELREGGVMLR
jgi:hypothetical protein